MNAGLYTYVHMYLLAGKKAKRLWIKLEAWIFSNQTGFVYIYLKLFLNLNQQFKNLTSQTFLILSLTKEPCDRSSKLLGASSKHRSFQFKIQVVYKFPFSIDLEAEPSNHGL